MKDLEYSNRFKKDYKHIQKRGVDIVKLRSIIIKLRKGALLPPSTRPHKLSGNWDGHWECHIEPNWLLIYKVTADVVFLAGTGSHPDLFK